MTRRLENPQILIVEPDEAVARSYAQMLRLQGHEVRVALSAPQGLREIEARPDVILIDFHMAEMNGLEFLRLIRGSEANRSTPVAIITGDYFLDDAVPTELAALGAVVRFKPLWLEELVTLVHGLLTGGIYAADFKDKDKQDSNDDK